MKSRRDRLAARSESTCYGDDTTIGEEETEKDGPTPAGNALTISFVYSAEVRNAVEKIKHRKGRRQKFNKDDVYIFKLPEIVRMCAPLGVFTPTVARCVTHQQERLPQVRRRKQFRPTNKHITGYTEDDYGVYLSWRVTQHDCQDATVPLKKPSGRRRKKIVDVESDLDVDEMELVPTSAWGRTGSNFGNDSTHDPPR